MATFTFFRHKIGGRAASFEIQMFDHHNEALAYAEQLLAQNPRYLKIEIFVDDRCLSTVERPSR